MGALFTLIIFIVLGTIMVGTFWLLPRKVRDRIIQYIEEVGN